MGKTATPKKSLQQPIRKAQTFDRLKSKKGIVRRVPVYLDSDIVEEYEQAKAEVDLLQNPVVASRTTEEQKNAAVARYEAAKANLEENTVTIVLAAPQITVTDEDDVDRHLKGRLAYEHLLNTHQASEEDNAKHKEEHGQDAPYDGETFPPALVAACAHEPEMTVEQVAELFEDWNMNEVLAVFTACLEICNASQVGSLGKGYGMTNGSVRS